MLTKFYFPIGINHESTIVIEKPKVLSKGLSMINKKTSQNLTYSEMTDSNFTRRKYEHEQREEERRKREEELNFSLQFNLFD